MSTSLHRAVVPVSGPNTLQYRVRLATAADIPAIAQCNVDTLPENYSNQFYEMFLSRNSLLCFVAECPENQLLGYALGKITEYEVEGQLPFQQITAPKSFVGHVASIAVHESYRGFGVAKELMTCLHYNFAKHYHMDRVSLYVRVTNKGARKLYETAFHYKVDYIVPHYYTDGEDACYMIRDQLLTTHESPAPELLPLISLPDDHV
eukprot:gene302-193_t